jgi:hypothetical protein
MNMQPSLSALTPPVVDRLYHIDSATPVAAPVFLFLIGAPGAGKSSGHARAIDAGLLPPGNYATLNLDTLLESLTPFRAASAMGHLLKRTPSTRELTKFSSISAYGTRKENLGLFKWYNTAHDELAAIEPATIAGLNRVRATFAPLHDSEAGAKLTDLNEAALIRAVARSVPIVYETVFSLTKSGRVTKFDDITAYLKRHGSQYRVVVYHIRGEPAEVAARVRARQEYGMPYEDPPFYRYVPASEEVIAGIIDKNAAAFAALKGQYAGKAEFEEYENRLDPSRLAPERPFNATNQLRRITRAFGPRRRTSSQTLRSSWRVSTPRASSGSSLRYSTATSERRRRTRKTTRQ